MYKLVCAAKDNIDVKVQIAISTFVSTWLYDFPPAVKEFLTEGSNVQHVRSPN
jgi:Uso1 / p115 like vesicle tethering protein, head region